MLIIAAAAPAVKPSTLSIKGNAYRVSEIDPGECGVSAVRLIKLVDGEVYDLIRTRADVVECSCPDFVRRHEGKGTVCKHGAAMVARGFLPAAPVEVEQAVAPITARDRARASYFGIRLPAVAKVEARTVDLSSMVLIVAAPACEPVVRTTAPRPADVREMAAWLARAETPAGGLPVAGPAATAMDAAEFRAWKREPGARFVPTDEDDADRLGFELGREGESASAPAGWDFPRLVAFYTGWLAGDSARVEAERDEQEGWHDSPNEPDWGAMYPDHDPLHPIERAEVGPPARRPA